MVAERVSLFTFPAAAVSPVTSPGRRELSAHKWAFATFSTYVQSNIFSPLPMKNCVDNNQRVRTERLRRKDSSGPLGCAEIIEYSYFCCGKGGIQHLIYCTFSLPALAAATAAGTANLSPGPKIPLGRIAQVSNPFFPLEPSTTASAWAFASE